MISNIIVAIKGDQISRIIQEGMTALLETVFGWFIQMDDNFLEWFAIAFEMQKTEFEVKEASEIEVCWEIWMKISVKKN